MDMIPVTRSCMPPFEEYVEEIRPLWENRWLTNMGEKHRALEAKLGAYLGCGMNLRLFTNGHTALEAMLRAFAFPEGAEVITTPYTFASTTNAIIRCGLVPVFCDVRESDLTMDPALVEPLITEKTVAILPVHVYGNIADADALGEIAQKHGLKLLFDAAHAFGVKLKTGNVGTLGDASMFSFHATKVFHTIEGGCVTFKDPALGVLLDAEKNFGLAGKKDTYETVGGNAKMNEFAAAMGLCNLRHLDEQIASRKKAAARYRELLAGKPGVMLISCRTDAESNEIYFPILLPSEAERDALAEKLLAANVMARKYFYPATNEMPRVAERFDAGYTPVAASAARRVLTLPLYPELTTEQVEYICGLI